MDHTDDTQRLLEQRALRNVRALVDKLDRDERARPGFGRVFVSSVAVAVLLIATALLCLWLVVQPEEVPRVLTLQSAGSTYRPYLKEVFGRIERAAAANYPAEIRDMAGQVGLKIAIRSDGTIKSIEVNDSSGNPALDKAAENFVRSAAPFPSFRFGQEALYVTQTLTFAKRGVKPELR